MMMTPKIEAIIEFVKANSIDIDTNIDNLNELEAITKLNSNINRYYLEKSDIDSSDLLAKESIEYKDVLDLYSSLLAKSEQKEYIKKMLDLFLPRVKATIDGKDIVAYNTTMLTYIELIAIYYDEFDISKELYKAMLKRYSYIEYDVGISLAKSRVDDTTAKKLLKKSEKSIASLSDSESETKSNKLLACATIALKTYNDKKWAKSIYETYQRSVYISGFEYRIPLYIEYLSHLADDEYLGDKKWAKERLELVIKAIISLKQDYVCAKYLPKLLKIAYHPNMLNDTTLGNDILKKTNKYIKTNANYIYLLKELSIAKCSDEKVYNKVVKEVVAISNPTALKQYAIYELSGIVSDELLVRLTNTTFDQKVFDKNLKTFGKKLKDKDENDEYMYHVDKSKAYWDILSTWSEKIPLAIACDIIAYYELTAKCSNDFLAIARSYYKRKDLFGYDKELAIETYKIAQEKIESFLDAYYLANNIIYIQKSWAREVYQRAYDLATTAEEFLQLADSVCSDIKDYRHPELKDKEWARAIYQKALETAKTKKDKKAIAQSIGQDRYLDDKEWSKKIIESI
jgi:hypothetical protein